MNKYEFYTILISGIAIGISIINIFLWYINQSTNKKDRRQKYFQQLINIAITHNWKIIENWDNEGARPFLKETMPYQEQKNYFGKRIMVLDHLNLLWLLL